MNEKDREPWNQNFYQTGYTQPPKRRGGCVLFLVILVILLGGIVTLMGLLNIRLFRAVATGEKTPAVGFVSEETTASAETEEATAATTTQGGLSLELESAPQSVENVPQEGGLSLQAIYEKAIPSVVSVLSANGSGTGVIVSQDGFIVTNQHVVGQMAAVEVLLTDGRRLEASVVGADGASDLAVLRVDAQGLTPAEFGDSASLRVGDAVVAIGDPLGVELRGTMTNGIVSAINRDITTGGRTLTLIQTNAALNNGNSGGPLLNCYGQVVGINTMKIGDNVNVSGVEGLGFAIPATTVKEVVDQLANQGFVSGRPSLGLEVQSISAFDRLYYRLPQGLYITSVDAGSDAAKQGILAGDILLQLDSTRLYDVSGLQSALYGYNAGDTVELIIYRSGMQYSVPVVLSEAK